MSQFAVSMAEAQFVIADVTVLDRPVEQPAVTSGIGVNVGDLNDDGFDDIAFVSAVSGAVVLGGSTLDSRHRLEFPQSTAYQTYDLAVGDIDRDGDLDLVVASNNEPNPLSVHLNDGHGQLASAVPIGISGIGIEAEDMNGDGFTDLVTGAPDGIKIYLSTGATAFASPIESGLNTPLVDVGRITNDEVPDILGREAIRVSTVSIQEGTVHAFPSDYPLADALVDVDGDFLAEIIAVGSDIEYLLSSNLVVIQFTGFGFTESVIWYLPVISPTAVCALDYDNDSDLDLALVPLPPNDLSFSVNSTPLPCQALLITNDGQGGLTPDRSIAVGGVMPASVDAGDFDGIPGDDLAVGNRGLKLVYSSEGASRLVGRSVVAISTSHSPAHTPQQLMRVPLNNSISSDIVLADLNDDSVADLIALQGSRPSVRLASHPGIFDETAIWNCSQTATASRLALADIDNDGDFEVVAYTSHVGSPHEVRLEPFANAPNQYLQGHCVRLIALPPHVRATFPGRAWLVDLNKQPGAEYITFRQGTVSQNRTTLYIERFESGQWVQTSQLVAGLIYRIELIDANNDSAPDLLLYRTVDVRNPACECWQDWRLEVYLNDGQGGFATPTTLLKSVAPISGLITADFAGDSRPDVLTTLHDGSVRVFTQLDSGLSEATTTIIAPRVLLQPTAADFDLDGRLDIAGATFPDAANDSAFSQEDASTFLFGSGLGVFLHERSLPHHGVIPVAAHSFDLNLDEAPDYVMLNAFGGITLYPNLSTPTKCPADANGDLLIDGRDLSLLLSTFGDTSVKGRGADLNSDGVIDGADLGVLLSQYGTACQ